MDSAQIEAGPAKRDYSKRINYALAGTLMHSGLSLDEIAIRVGAANSNSLRAALHRKGVTKRQAVAVLPGAHHVTQLTARVATDAAEMVRERLGNRLATQIDKLSSKPPSRRGLASKGQGEAAVLKTMAETHRALFGGADQVNIVFGVGSLRDEPVIDAEVIEPVKPDATKTTQGEI